MTNIEKKLKQYQNAIDNSNIVSKTDINGNITFVNDEFCKICGYSKDELIGKNHNIIRHPDVSKDKFEELWKTILSKKIHKSIVKNLAKDGSSFFWSTTIAPILDDDGNIEEFVAIRQDVTNLVELNEQLSAAKDELKKLNDSLTDKVKEQTKCLLELNKNLEKRVAEEVNKNEEKTRVLFQQSRLAAMGEMIGNIAHQWRQPLNEIGIDAFKMKQSINNPELLSNAYNHLKLVIKAMSKTIDDFRDFFNINREKEFFAVSESIYDSKNLIKGQIEKELIYLKIDIINDFEIFGFKSELTQVVLNLISNAKDALKNSSQSNKTIYIKIYEKDQNGYILVMDNGGGIENDVIDRIFEPYFTTKHPNQGTGLGLYMSKMIIEHMNGQIKVSNLGNNAVFEIKIPIRGANDE